MLLGLVVSATVAAAPAEAGALSSTTADDRGVAAFERGDFASAAAELEGARADAPRDLDLSLLLGISYYRLGRTRDAEPLIEAAAESTDQDTAATARLFLGLIAHDKGEVDQARALFGDASRATSPEIAAGASALISAVSPKMLTLGFLLRTEYDSNVSLTSLSAVPSTSAGGTADGAALGLASAVFRPFSEIGLTVSDTAAYRKHLQLTSYDLFSNTAGAHWEYLGSTDRLNAGYAFDVATLGGPLYYYGSSLDVGYRRAIDEDIGVGARYVLRHRNYSLADYQPYTGFAHTGTLEVGYGTPEDRLELNLGAIGIRELTSDSTLTATALGVRAYGRGASGPIFGSVSVTGLERTFDARRDSQIIGELTFGYAISTSIAAVAGASYVRNLSNVSDFDYKKWVTHLGVEYTMLDASP